MYFYSPSHNRFYAGELKENYIEAGSFPKDVIEVADTVWTEYAGNQPPKGKLRIAGDDGMPCWADVPQMTKEEAIRSANAKMTRLMNAATKAIAPLQDAVDLDISTPEEVESLKAWKTYRVLLSRVDTADAPDIEWPDSPA